MAEDESKDEKDKDESKPAPVGRQPIAPGVRHRLQKCFEHGTQCVKRGDFDYATTMFTQCLEGDPGNMMYAQNFLGNLHKKYNNNKKGSKLASLSGMTIKGGLKKASMKKEWATLLKNGLEMLKLNPWDVFTLTNMAHACEELGYDECQLAYLKSALDANSKDIEVNRLCGKALGPQGQFDQAIVCWHRVEQAKPGDEEAQRAIASLSVEKTISKGKFEEEATNALNDADEAATAKKHADKVAHITPEQRLQKAIDDDPAEIRHYLELADLFTRAEKYLEAEKVLAKGLEASGGDIKLREQLEDTQLRRGRSQLLVAEQRAKAENTPENVKLYKRMKAEVNQLETEVYRSRSERYPQNMNLTFELGLRLKRGGNFPEAIRVFQLARNDPKRRGSVMLELGECFYNIKQYRLAMTNYSAALEVIPERDEDLRKTGLYRAGKLSLALAQQESSPAADRLKDLDTADKYFTELAGLDFGYKDVAECLDKINKERHKG